ncbi:[4Fe-4S] cluster assembly scaffold protein Mrp (=ApbC) [hydrothermal vent metagenome]|uniref:[4Fe-4S] cluster assembly scaffold protein Mrp (=ApbC) n=1 Tax=hydrothermal vent metagenome TaxID=652676 RepID=A0A3B0YW73_9ZZZZ
MSDSLQTEIKQALAGYIDPYLKQDLLSAGALKSVEVDGGNVTLKITLGFPCEGYHAALIKCVNGVLQGVEGVENLSVAITTNITSHSVRQGVTPLPGVRNIIAIASGKGGVGKSTTSVNLALALKLEGAKVGILDADIYGPSQPTMLGCHQRPQYAEGEKMQPLVSHGIQSMSIGYLIDEETPMVWRGPMVVSALQQLLGDTAWHDLDYLIIDLPPGTGDIQLTMAQKVPVTGSVIVTTPQDIALLDARKGISMFEKVSVPVMGIIENMSTHICRNCGHEESIFGTGGAARIAEQHATEVLGSMPLDIRIRENVDKGMPTVAIDPEGELSLRYRDIARRVAAQVSLMGKDYSAKFPNIVIKNS